VTAYFFDADDLHQAVYGGDVVRLYLNVDGARPDDARLAIARASPRTSRSRLSPLSWLWDALVGCS
jgi:hypothetical protein